MNNIFEQEATNLSNAKKWKDIHKVGQKFRKDVANFRLETGYNCLVCTNLVNSKFGKHGVLL